MTKDPTGAECRAILEANFPLSCEDEVDVAQAIYWFAADYHGGQSSNLYSALSCSPYKPGMIESGPEPGTLAAELYDTLVTAWGA